MSLSESPKTNEPFCLQTLETPVPPRIQCSSVQPGTHAADCILEDISSTLRRPLKQGGRTGQADG